MILSPTILCVILSDHLVYFDFPLHAIAFDSCVNNVVFEL